MKETRRRFEVNRLNEDLVGCSATVFGLGCCATLRIHPYLEDRSQVSSEEAIHCAPPLICDGGLPEARDRAFFIGMQCAHQQEGSKEWAGEARRCDAIATSRSSCGSPDTPSRVSALVRRRGADPTCATSASPMNPKSPDNPLATARTAWACSSTLRASLGPLHAAYAPQSGSVRTCAAVRCAGRR
jgi:hypothetical protein